MRKAQGKPSGTDRKERLARALRQNLRRRKQADTEPAGDVSSGAKKQRSAKDDDDRPD